jgi:hypothetical protein
MIGFVVNYCSNEKPFIEPLLHECSKVSTSIIVSYGSHLYDGRSEVAPTELKALFPHVKFVEYAVDCTADLKQMPGVTQRPTAYWHNLARWTGIQALPPSVEWVFLLDADEIPDGDALLRWLTTTLISKKEVYKFASYWYFKTPTNQAETLEESMTLVSRSALTIATVFHDIEREWLFCGARLRQRRMVHAINPIVHHYSWARSRTGLATKLRTWAHRDDRYKGVNIEDILNEIFKDEGVNDIVHGYTYKTVPNQFGIRLE